MVLGSFVNVRFKSDQRIWDRLSRLAFELLVLKDSGLRK